MNKNTRRTLLVAAAGFVAMAVFLETEIASLHGVTLRTLDEHKDVPGLPHVFGFISVAFSLWPVAVDARHVLRRRSFPWLEVAAAAGALVGLLSGWIVTTAACVLIFSLAAALMHRRRTEGS